MSYKYVFDGKEYDSWDACKALFPTVPFPEESEVTDDDLEIFSIKRILVEEPHVETEEEAKARIRAVRNQMLRDTDCTMLPDYPQVQTLYDSYRSYRQYLRDYPTQENWWLSEPLDFVTWLGSANEEYLEPSTGTSES